MEPFTLLRTQHYARLDMAATHCVPLSAGSGALGDRRQTCRDTASNKQKIAAFLYSLFCEPNRTHCSCYGPHIPTLTLTTHTTLLPLCWTRSATAPTAHLLARATGVCSADHLWPFGHSSVHHRVRHCWWVSARPPAPARPTHHPLRCGACGLSPR